MVCIMNKVYSIQCEMWTHQFVVIYLFYFYLLASPKKPNKQTKKETNGKNVGGDTATAVANYSGPVYRF